MLRRLSAVSVVVAGLTCVPGLRAAEPDLNSPQIEFFERKIRPLFVARCMECHSAAKQKGGLSLESGATLKRGGDSGAAVVPGSPEASLLIEAVGHAGDIKMPPREKLPEADIADLVAWVKAGAVWPPQKLEPAAGSEPQGFVITPEQRAFWAFQPIVNPAPPEVQDASWVRTRIDRFVLAELDRQGLAPSMPAEKPALLRRTTFDLTGLPPTPDEVDAFLEDESDEAFSRVVDRLLASPRYGERWGRHWLDVARYAEDQAHTFQARKYPSGYRYRDWVVGALNDDLPYDQFVVQQIAGDLLPDSSATDGLAALGYFALGPVYYADAGCAAKAALDELDDRVDTLAAGFLGLTVACARCHDHKFDPISQQDYYALAGVFASSAYREAPLVPQEVVDAYDQGQAAIRKSQDQVNTHLDAEARRVGETLVSASAQYLNAAWRLAHPADPAQPPSRAALARELGLHDVVLERWQKWVSSADRSKLPQFADWFALCDRKEVPAVESGKSAPDDLLAASEAAQAALVAALEERNRLDNEYAAAMAAAPEADKGKIAKPVLEKGQAELLAALLTRDGPLSIPRDRVEPLLDDGAKQQLAAVKAAIEEAKKAAPAKYPFVHSLTEGKPADMKLHIRGNPAVTGDEVPRRFLEILSSEGAGTFATGSGRLELARAIASPENPLTARVIVNRIWMHHFGRGIVPTPSNFGRIGERPSHPQLLDYLARCLIDGGWSLKSIHREILLSAVYRQSAAFDPEKFERDPDNVWLWRMSRRRLDVESWRDALLSVVDGLDVEVGGPPGSFTDAGFARRTLYGAISRHNLDGMLRLFDFPDPNITSARRTLTTVPLQQLFVLNSDFMSRRSQQLAARLARELPDDESARIRRAYLLLYGRTARDDEVQWGLEFLRPPADEAPASASGSRLSRWEQYAQVLLASNEFAYVD